MKTPDKLSVILKEFDEQFILPKHIGIPNIPEDKLMRSILDIKSFITSVYSQGLAEGKKEERQRILELPVMKTEPTNRFNEENISIVLRNQLREEIIKSLKDQKK